MLDPVLIPYLTDTLAQCEAACTQAAISFTSEICSEDFIAGYGRCCEQISPRAPHCSKRGPRTGDEPPVRGQFARSVGAEERLPHPY